MSLRRDGWSIVLRRSFGYRFTVFGLRKKPYRAPCTAHRTPNRSFTLIELMLAVTILAFGLVGIIQSYSAMITGLTIAQKSLDTVCILKEALAEVQSKAAQNGGTTLQIAQKKWSREFKGFVSKVKVSDASFYINFPEEDKDPVRYLNKIEAFAFNEDVKPPRKFGIVTYAKNLIEKQ
ncbi:prepilin-type N-terminal cleavage/methylation domain-containing protein [Candidatus Omnitrophota bacterium]